jgi:hypothetical protein
VTSTIKAATLLAARPAAAGVISTKVAKLMEGVLKAMLLNKLTGTLVVLALAVAVLIGGGGQLLPTHAEGAGAELTIPLKTADEDFNKTILAVEASWWEVAMKRDPEAMSKLYADDFVAFSERGRSDKAANVAADKLFRSANPKFRNVEIVRVNNDAAIVTYRLDVDVLGPDGNVRVRVRDSRMSNCWACRDGKWVMVLSQMTQMPSGASPRSIKVPIQFKGKDGDE